MNSSPLFKNVEFAKSSCSDSDRACIAIEGITSDNREEFIKQLPSLLEHSHSIEPLKGQTIGNYLITDDIENYIPRYTKAWNIDQTDRDKLSQQIGRQCSVAHASRPLLKTDDLKGLPIVNIEKSPSGQYIIDLNDTVSFTVNSLQYFKNAEIRGIGPLEEGATYFSRVRTEWGRGMEFLTEEEQLSALSQKGLELRTEEQRAVSKSLMDFHDFDMDSLIKKADFIINNYENAPFAYVDGLTKDDYISAREGVIDYYKQGKPIDVLFTNGNPDAIKMLFGAEYFYQDHRMLIVERDEGGKEKSAIFLGGFSDAFKLGMGMSP